MIPFPLLGVFFIIIIKFVKMQISRPLLFASRAHLPAGGVCVCVPRAGCSGLGVGGMKGGSGSGISLAFLGSDIIRRRFDFSSRLSTIYCYGPALRATCGRCSVALPYMKIRSDINTADMYVREYI